MQQQSPRPGKMERASFLVALIIASLLLLLFIIPSLRALLRAAFRRHVPQRRRFRTPARPPHRTAASPPILPPWPSSSPSPTPTTPTEPPPVLQRRTTYPDKPLTIAQVRRCAPAVPYEPADSAAASDAAAHGADDDASNSPQSGGQMREVCPVCLDDFVARQSVCTLPCTHHFHASYVCVYLALRRICPPLPLFREISHGGDDGTE